MLEISVYIDGQELKGIEGESILDVCLRNAIKIPTLCHDERVKTYGSCGICVVELENSPRLVRSCSTLISKDMVIKTNTQRVIETRKTALELLLSDHTGDCRPPCVTACPGRTDCQGYVGLIANGQYKEALELVKDVIPLPASIGRVCPHPCEDACRRKMVEEPISIANLKYFVADLDLDANDVFTPEIEPETGKNIAVIGGGPGGLTAAYFLARAGHTVTIYDKMPKMGGMLRYGIPEYRLPKRIVDAEIATIEKIGIKMVNNVEIGRDISFKDIRENADSCLIAIGAWASTALRCPGEGLNGVVGGIDFLRDFPTNYPDLAGKKIAVVGGGNTAMDACRTAVRLGCAEVYNIYRRTKTEMPADKIEIIEAEEEGVIFKNLSNPIEVIGKDGNVNKLRLQIMKLGEADASGRRSPVPIPDKEEMLEVDIVIVAIGQIVNPNGFENLDLTKWKTISADETTYRTNLEGVFAIGDATNNGAGIAIEAIGDAKRAVGIINGYLIGENIEYKEPFIVKREMKPKDFQEKQKIVREKMHHLKPEERSNNFSQVNFGYTEEQAKKEAARCLECGCADYFECKLYEYANDYFVKPEKFEGDVHKRELDLSNPFIYRNPDKCILCGLCVRVCDEVMGRSALGLIDRGFDAVVSPSLMLPLTETDCISCGQCATVCPVGAIGEILPIDKNVPVKEEVTHSVCSFCSVGCRTKVTTKGGLQTRSLPDDDNDKTNILCARGRFGFGILQQHHKITSPLVRNGENLVETNMGDALLCITKKAKDIAAKYGNNKLAVSISDKYSNEEIYLINKYAKEILQTENVYSLNLSESGLVNVFGKDGSPNTFEELTNTEVILIVCPDIVNTHTIAGIKIKKAVENGAKLIVIGNEETQANEWATLKINTSENLDVLKEFLKALFDLGAKPENVSGQDELKNYLKEINVSEEIFKAAEMYYKAKKSMIVFDRQSLTSDASRLIADISVVSGHIGSPSDGIIELLPNNNSQGLLDMGVKAGRGFINEQINNQEIKGLLVFGEDIPQIDTKNLEFLMVFDSVMTETARKADIVLPSATFAETCGTYTSTERAIQGFDRAITPELGMENWEIIKSLINVSNISVDCKNINEIRLEISERIDGYKKIDTNDFSKSKVYRPLSLNHILFRETEKVLALPKNDVFFAEYTNTNFIYNEFMNYMHSQGLIRT